MANEAHNDLVAQRRANLEIRARIAAHLDGRWATLADICSAVGITRRAASEQLRVLKQQGLARKCDGFWGRVDVPAPVFKAGHAPLEGSPRITLAPAVQLGMMREPLVAALFGNGPAQR